MNIQTIVFSPEGITITTPDGVTTEYVLKTATPEVVEVPLDTPVELEATPEAQG